MPKQKSLSEGVRAFIWLHTRLRKELHAFLEDVCQTGQLPQVWRVEVEISGKKVLAYESVATFSGGPEAAEIILSKENIGEDAVAQVKENAQT